MTKIHWGTYAGNGPIRIEPTANTITENTWVPGPATTAANAATYTYENVTIAAEQPKKADPEPTGPVPEDFEELRTFTKRHLETLGCLGRAVNARRNRYLFRFPRPLGTCNTRGVPDRIRGRNNSSLRKKPPPPPANVLRRIPQLRDNGECGAVGDTMPERFWNWLTKRATPLGRTAAMMVLSLIILALILMLQGCRPKDKLTVCIDTCMAEARWGCDQDKECYITATQLCPAMCNPCNCEPQGEANVEENSTGGPGQSVSQPAEDAHGVPGARPRRLIGGTM